MPIAEAEVLMVPRSHPKDTSIPEVVIAEHRLPLVNRTASIWRYVYPGLTPFFQDNVKGHIYRMRVRAETLGLDPEVSHIIEVHDLPELKPDTGIGGVSTTDMTAVEKADNPKLAFEIENSEAIRAQEMLTREDYQRYLEFERAKDALMGNCPVSTVHPPAVVAKIIDLVDGAELFNEEVVELIAREGHYNLSEYCHLPSFALDFGKFEAFRQILPDLYLPTTYQRLCTELIDESTTYIAGLWGIISDHQIPRNLRPYVRPNLLK